MLSDQILTLLIVDDSAEDRFVARMLLSDSSLAGCAVHEAASGREAIEAAQRLRPDCVLLDQTLTDMDGTEVLTAWRDAAGDPAFAVVMLTGSGDEATATAAIRAGAQDYLSKSLITVQSLAWTVRGAISRFRLLRARRAEEARLRLFVERTPAAVALFDRDMRYVLASRRYVRDTVPEARESGDLIGRALREVIPELPETWHAVHRRALAGKTLSGEEGQLVRADGRVEWWRWELAPWHEADGTIGGTLVFAELLNARRTAADALRASEERLRISQEVAGIGTWDWNIRTGAIHWSPQQYRLFGLDPAELGDPEYDTWRLAIHPEDRDRANAQAMAAVEGKASYETEFRIMLPPARGGGCRWLYARGEVMRDADGTPLRMLGVNMDITERRETELALRRLTEDLEKRVAEEIAAREEGQARLLQAQRMEALGQDRKSVV